MQFRTPGLESFSQWKFWCKRILWLMEATLFSMIFFPLSRCSPNFCITMKLLCWRFFFFFLRNQYTIVDDVWAHILTTSRTSSKFAIPCNDINILLLIPELIGLGRYMLALHKNSPNTFLSSLYVWLALSPSLCSWAYLEKRHSWYMILQRVSSCSLYSSNFGKSTLSPTTF